MTLLTDFWRIITALGDFEVWIFIILLSSLIYILSPKSKKHKIMWLAFVLIPAVVISTVAVEILKVSTQVPRPCVGNVDCPLGYSFPSGHAARVFIFSTVVALSTRNLGINLASFILAVLVSISRVALNYHTYIDVIAGALVGVFVAYLASVLYRRKILSIKAFKRIIS